MLKNLGSQFLKEIIVNRKKNMVSRIWSDFAQDVDLKGLKIGKWKIELKPNKARPLQTLILWDLLLFLSDDFMTLKDTYIHFKDNKK